MPQTCLVPQAVLSVQNIPKHYIFTEHHTRLIHVLPTLTSIANMMDVITCLANFFNYSPKRQKCLESHVMNLSDETAKSKLLPLCRTRSVERLDALEVALDLAQAVIEAF